MSEVEKEIEKYKQLCGKAEEAYEESKKLESLSRQAFRQYVELTNDAISMICPFGIGDVIEFQERFGYRGKTRTVRMKINRFMFSLSGYSIEGRQINKNGELSYQKSFRVSEGDLKNPPAKLISKAEKKEG